MGGGIPQPRARASPGSRESRGWAIERWGDAAATTVGSRPSSRVGSGRRRERTRNGSCAPAWHLGVRGAARHARLQSRARSGWSPVTAREVLVGLRELRTQSWPAVATIPPHPPRQPSAMGPPHGCTGADRRARTSSSTRSSFGHTSVTTNPCLPWPWLRDRDPAKTRRGGGCRLRVSTPLLRTRPGSAGAAFGGTAAECAEVRLGRPRRGQVDHSGLEDRALRAVIHEKAVRAGAHSHVAARSLAKC
jgi:hypothetical protein